MVKTYFLAPTRDCPPSGPIALGNIIASPSSSEEPLNPEPVLPIPPIHQSNQTDWTAEIGRYRRGKIGIWTKFLQALGVGVDLSINFDLGTIDAYKFDKIETRFFVPDQAYVDKSVSSPEVQDFVAKSKFRANIYMITGIKIAIGASVASSMLKGRGMNLQLGLDGTTAGIPIGIGPDIELSSGRMEAVTFADSSDFVFAFRLREITYSKKRGVSHREFRKGALFGLDDGDRFSQEEPEEEVQDGFELLGSTEEDVGAEDVELEASEAVDDDDEICECVVLD